MNAARIPTARVDQIIDALNTYDGGNIWQDVIRRLPEYNDALTASCDPTDQCDVIGLTDGTILAWRTDVDAWAFHRSE